MSREYIPHQSENVAWEVSNQSLGQAAAKGATVSTEKGKQGWDDALKTIGAKEDDIFDKKGKVKIKSIGATKASHPTHPNAQIYNFEGKQLFVQVANQQYDNATKLIQEYAQAPLNTPKPLSPRQMTAEGISPEIIGIRKYEIQGDGAFHEVHKTYKKMKAGDQIKTRSGAVRAAREGELVDISNSIGGKFQDFEKMANDLYNNTLPMTAPASGRSRERVSN